MDHCAETCVFVGYGITQKGYRCYNPKTRHMFTTMNCDFLESEYYYASQHSSQGDRTKAFVAFVYSDEIPANIEQALKSRKWKKAMKEEMKALTKNNTWEKYVLPPGKKTVGFRWVFTIKYKPDGTIERYKARLVAKGYTQTYGIDYSETFSPVAKINTIGVLCSIAANKGWPLHQFDVKNAFLHGELKEEVYMKAPHGFTNKFGEREVCHLKKSLYGLKQSPRAWFGRFTLAMKNRGFKQSNSDHTLFLKQRGNLITCLIIYVDDMIVTGDDKEEITKLKKHLFTEFEMKHLGRLKYFLGIEVLRSKQGIFMCQKELADKGRYQRMVRKLIYLLHTRPDIAYAVGVVSQFMHQPQKNHMKAVMRILRYLKGTTEHGVLFKPNGHLVTQLYTDADWAGDKGNRRSTSGYFTVVGGNLIISAGRDGSERENATHSVILTPSHDVLKENVSHGSRYPVKNRHIADFILDYKRKSWTKKHGFGRNDLRRSRLMRTLKLKMTHRDFSMREKQL
nr:putative RNA-directed DNA polymerase [Tanacetum cinerariifolium]